MCNCTGNLEIPGSRWLAPGMTAYREARYLI